MLVKLVGLGLAISLVSFSQADIVWDTTAGAPGQTYRASYSNLIGPDWISVATPINLSKICSVDSMSFVGAHLRFDGQNLVPSDPANSSFTITAWSSIGAYQANPFSGDLWSTSASYTTSAFGFGGSANSALSLYKFSLLGSVSLPSGTSIIGIHTESVPVTDGEFYWSSTSDSAASGNRLKWNSTGIENLPNAQSLKIESVTTPEPTSMLAITLGVVAIIGKKKTLKK